MEDQTERVINVCRAAVILAAEGFDHSRNAA
jgi:hypothetical protein